MAFVFFFVLLLLVAVPLALGRGAFARNGIIAAMCIVLLGAYVEALLWWWPFYFLGNNIVMSVFVPALLPLETAALLVFAATVAPLIALPSLAFGAALGSLAAWPLWQRKRPRLAAALWVAIVPFVSLFAAETLVTAQMQRSAAEQFPAGYCTVLSRLSLSQMIKQQTFEERSEYVVLIADRADYYWSFRERRFLKRGNTDLGYECGRRL